MDGRGDMPDTNKATIVITLNVKTFPIKNTQLLIGQTVFRYLKANLQKMRQKFRSELPF